MYMYLVPKINVSKYMYYRACVGVCLKVLGGVKHVFAGCMHVHAYHVRTGLHHLSSLVLWL